MNNGTKSLSIGFTGDISFSGIYKDKVLNNQNISEYINSDIVDFLARNDWNVGNIEGPLTRSTTPTCPGLPLKSPIESAMILHQLKINCYNIANNHIMDYGIQGLADTYSCAYQNHVKVLGAGSDVVKASQTIVFEKSGIKVGLIAVAHNEGMLASTNSPGVFSERDIGLIRKRIKELTSTCDWVILNYHGGEEYSFVPSPLRRSLFLSYLDYGVNIIIAHHSHVIQGYEYVKDKCIFYSLGNFIFDITSHSRIMGTDESLIITLIFTRTGYDIDTLFTKLDKTRGNIQKTAAANSFHQINNNNYRRKWEEEANRIIYNHFSQNNLDPKARNSIFYNQRVFFWIIRLFSLIKRLNDHIFRNIVISACKYKFKNFLMPKFKTFKSFF